MDKTVTFVKAGSLAERAGIRPGEEITALNGSADYDIIDMLFAEADDSMSLTVKSAEGAAREVRIKNDFMRPVGISFENPCADRTKLCANRCIFCFLDQMPGGLRESLYVRDDDYMLSFLYGNYITLTNLKDEEFRRIIEKKLSPLYVSVHATESELRRMMMKNPHSSQIMQRLRQLRDGGIEFNLQIVLCPDVNDKEHLVRSLEDIITLMPAVRSLSVVPVGLTGRREGLYPLRKFTPTEASEVIDTVDRYNAIVQSQDDSVCFCASDEFYLLSGRDIPPERHYGEYAQIENGVGMLRSFLEDEEDYFTGPEADDLTGIRATLITGVLGRDIITSFADRLNEECGSTLDVCCIDSAFFGGFVTASGLVCGSDIIKGIQGKAEGKTLLVPEVMLKEDEDIFLDGVTLSEVSDALKAKAVRVPCDVFGLIAALKETFKDE